MNNQDAIKWVRAIMATQNQSIHKASCDDRIEALLMGIQALEEQDKHRWITNTVPKCKDRASSEEVLVTVNNGIHKRVIKAVYIPYRHCTVEDMCWNMYDGIPDDWEYIEEEDTWWVPQGWYEVCDYFEDYSYSSISDEVIAWMPLIEPYKEE